MTEIRRWLERRGLGRHASLFSRLNIDVPQLLQFSEADLADLGLAPALRQAILREIQVAADVSAALPSDKAERRQLTLMFCDLVDSVSLSTHLDPEDLRDLIAAYQRTCAQSVERFGGFMARYLGDGILAYFGYPTAHEDDAERAIRAGLELARAVNRINRGTDQFSDLDLDVRVGIATGLVIVGDTVAENVFDRDAVVGEAANLAARLQAVAEPNTVVVSDVTRQLAPNRFEYRDLGVQELKGFGTPVSAHQVIGEREVTRLEARGTALTPFVGREGEIAVLLDLWRRSSSQQGQIVILAGVAGIGKSRTAAEAAERISQHGGLVPSPVVLQYSPHYSNASLHPLATQLARMAAIRSDDPPAAKFAKLVEFLGNGLSDHHTSVPLIAELLGIDPEMDRPALALGPTMKRHLTIKALTEWFAHLGRDRPVLIVFEDVQWIDPTSQLLLARLADLAKTARFLIVVTLRTDSRAALDAFVDQSGLVAADGRRPDHVTVCEIGELSASEGRRLAEIAATNDGRDLDAVRLDDVLAKSGGVPLYLEELAKAAASGVELSGNRDDSGDRSVVPNTLRDALMAQLDQLGFAKEVAQHASVVGTEFHLSLLAKVTRRLPSDLAPVLDRLIDSRIVVRESGTSDAYRFKHALIRDISYRSLLRKNRREMHRLIAQELARLREEASTVSYDLIAQHFSLADAHLEAIQYWQRGATQAIAGSANEEALAMLRSALLELEKFHGPEPPGLELDLVLAQVTALRSVRGYSATEVEERLARARRLCTVSGDFTRRFSVEWGLFLCTFVKGDIESAGIFAADLLEHAEHDPNQFLVDANLANGMVAFNGGEFEASMKFHRTAVALSRPETDMPRFLTHGQNAGLFCLSYLARTECILGHLDRGTETIQRARAIAALRSGEQGHIHSHLNTAIHAVRVWHLCGDLDAEKDLATETIEIAKRNGYAYYEALGACHLGWAIGTGGDVEEGIHTLTAGLAALRQTGTALSLPGFHILLGRLYLQADRLSEARSQLAMASPSKGFALWDADIERLRGDIIARREPTNPAAEAAYRSSLAIANRQQARLLVCKAGVSLASLLQSHDRRQEGYDVLKECLAQMSEGQDLAPIRQARALMEELAEHVRV